jgi:hypothetical protein
MAVMEGLTGPGNGGIEGGREMAMKWFVEQGRLGHLIGATLTYGALSAIMGGIWGSALGFGAVAGAKWVGIGGAGIAFVLWLGFLPLNYRARKSIASGMGVTLGGLWLIVCIIGLAIWLIRALI